MPGPCEVRGKNGPHFSHLSEDEAEKVQSKRRKLKTDTEKRLLEVVKTSSSFFLLLTQTEEIKFVYVGKINFSYSIILRPRRPNERTEEEKTSAQRAELRHTPHGG